jgi:2-polyprenyl-3-methyl-5-hydroxy-6-metoxy-1,4-benzoquinol methylase
MQDTDSGWETLGKNEPYWAVLTSDDFKQLNLTEEALDRFFFGGDEYVNDILQIIHQHLDPCFKPDRVCDFGCGVGRLMIPFAHHSREIVGIDISKSMLKECEKNLNGRQIDNYKLVTSDDNLTSLTGSFNLIHSFIVFQHIPVKRGVSIINNLLAHLEDTGILVLHVKYSPNRGWFRLFKKIVKLILMELHLYKPIMQMNSYPLNDLFWMLQSKSLNHCYIRFSEDKSSSQLGMIIFAQKNHNISHPQSF